MPYVKNSHTLHQNLTPPNTPRQLCLFEEDPYEAMHRHTPSGLLDKIANWLQRAAIQSLHVDGQPLEPLLLSQSRLLVDVELLDASQADQTWQVELVSETPLILYARKANLAPEMKRPLHIKFCW
ncbi:MAG: hypothetical protein IPK52_27230 [Chloroflexi bacterium]|nr:hypothetical protein [Chloroflexota bacterium]